METFMEPYVYFREGLVVLEAFLNSRFPLANLRVKPDGSSWRLVIEVVEGTSLPVSFLSRVISLTLGISSYTIETRCHARSGAPLRIVSAAMTDVSYPPPLPMTHLFVIFGSSSNDKQPLGSFLSRIEAESIITSGKLLGKLSESSQNLFDQYIVEKWQIGELVESTSQVLTTFDSKGTLLISFPEEDKTVTLGRLTSILSSSLDPIT